MSAKHTPGPWTGGKDIAIRAIDSERIGFSLVFMNTDLKEVKLTCLANARLIAAAPGLLEALQALHSNGHLMHFTSDTPEDCAIKSKALSAIRKALGEEE